MVKRLSELHGGVAAVESAEGEGSRFTVWLPLRAPEHGAVAPTRVPGERQFKSRAGARTALVVEDDFKSAELIRLQLEAEGFNVLHAASAEAALAIAVQQSLALITLDLMLPNMDGWELLGRVKQIPALKHCPVVIISIVADRNKGFALGAAAVMQKPMSRQDLSETLVELGLLPVAGDEPPTVLVVDDDPKAAELIAVSISGLPITILHAHGGREAIAIARREIPDLILLDLMMPDVSGFEVVEALGEEPNTARIPIVVITAKKISDEDRTRLNGYVSAIMEKTEFGHDRIAAEVRRALSLVPSVQ
jgi:CheY-like chemotaxis protein